VPTKKPLRCGPTSQNRGIIGVTTRLQMIHSCLVSVYKPKSTHKGKAMMRVLKPLQDKATTGAGKRLVLPEPRRIRFLIRGEGPVSAGAVTIECCPESTKAGKFWMELATIPVPADNGLAQYYTEEASGLFRARISRPVSNGTVTVTPLVSRGRPDRPDRTKVV
jgi:hypothetical protein